MTRMRTLSIGTVVAAILWLAVPSGAYLSSTWYEDASGYAEAVRQQKMLHTPLFVYFRVDWCPHCRSFDQLLEDSKVRAQLGAYIKVRINPEHGEAERAIFTEMYGAKGYPALFFHDSDGGSPRRLSAKGPAEHFMKQFPGGITANSR